MSADPDSLALAVPPELLDAIAEGVADRLGDRLPAQPQAEPWLDVEGAARHLVCQKQRIHDLVSQGRLRHAKDGRRTLFRREWLDAYLEGGDG